MRASKKPTAGGEKIKIKRIKAKGYRQRETRKAGQAKHVKIDSMPPGAPERARRVKTQ